MVLLRVLASVLPLLPSVVAGLNYSSSPEALQRQFLSTFDDRPKDCPPCFNCLLPAFECQQFSDCRSFDGKCDCAPGFGGEDCSQPLCGALSDGKDRYPRQEKYCECKDGWDGINCNLCTNDDACNSMMPEDVDGVCYKGGITVKENYQMCDVTNRKILEELKEDRPQVTFSCKKEEATCEFQFWVEHDESFYCALDHCKFESETTKRSNITHYDCENIKCKCVPDKLLCGKGTGIDLTDFLTEEIKGPATFSCRSSSGHNGIGDKCEFSEPHMNDLISGAFGDETIELTCNAAECLSKTQVPGWTPPKNVINGPAIAGAIAGSLLFLICLVLLVWFLHRRSQQKAGLGPIHLSLDGDESGKLITEHKPASLHFEDVSYAINGRVLLSGVHGAVNPGQVMAIMGASGAGKTTFLDILARKNKRGTVTGNILINGLKVSDDEFRNVIGFVDQEDTMMPTLTVYETILNSALLRLPRDMDYASKDKRVFEVMQQLGIYAIKDQLVGSQEGERGISGGEKRRVGIACELVTSPAILFLDEPTSGLDSFNAYNVVECLVSLAQNYNRTIIFTIHQPRSNIVALFDRLVLLARGKMVYSGEYRSCQRYFTDIGYPCPPGFNIADYLVDLTMHASSTRSEDVSEVPSANESSDETATTSVPRKRMGRKRGDSIKDRQERALFTRKNSQMSQNGEAVPLNEVSEELNPTSEWATETHYELQRQHEEDAELPPLLENGTTELDTLIQTYVNSDISKSVHDEIQIVSTNGQNGTLESVIGSGPVKGFTRIGWWSQFAILSSRTWKNLYRNPMLMLTHYVIAIILALLSGFLFYHVTDDIRGFQNRMGLFFFVLALFGFSTLTSLTVFSQERLLFVRERANGYYSPITYFCAKVIFDIVPLRIFPPIILGAIVYPMVGFIPEWPAFFKFILVLVLFNFSAATICLFIGIVCNDTGLANLIGSLVMLFSLLMAGLLLNHDSIPVVAQWLQKISIFHYGFEALIVNEVRYITLIDHKYGLDIEVPGATILTTFGFDNLAYWPDVSGLAIFAGTFIFFAYVAMHFLLVERR